jgi:hypothetical protein
MPALPPSSTPEQASPEFRYDAFISYSHKDKRWVYDVLLPFLERHGLSVCIDTRDFAIGLPSLVNIENAVQQSRKTLLILTPNWVASEWTNFESLLLQTDDPIGRGRRMLPIMVQDCTLPDRLRIFTYLDLRDSAEFDMQMARLVAAIRDTSVSTQTPGISPASRPAPAGYSLARGLERLGKLLANADTETMLNFAVLEARLQDNLRGEQVYGSTETLRHERAQIVEQLNRIAVDRLGRSFNNLCAIQSA